MPFKIGTGNIGADIESLVRSNGKLASYLFGEERRRGRRTFQGKIEKINHQPSEAIHQSMIFGEKYPNFIKGEELEQLIEYVSD